MSPSSTGKFRTVRLIQSNFYSKQNPEVDKSSEKEKETVRGSRIRSGRRSTSRANTRAKGVVLRCQGIAIGAECVRDRCSSSSCRGERVTVEIADGERRSRR